MSDDVEALIERFYSLIEPKVSDESNKEIERLICTIGKASLWPKALAAIEDWTAPDNDRAEHFGRFWQFHGTNLGCWLRSDRVPLIDAFKAVFPPYPGPDLTLYRGQGITDHERKDYGLSWSLSLTTARSFADHDRVPAEGEPVVLKIAAKKHMIVAQITNDKEFHREYEYILDPRSVVRHVEIVEKRCRSTK